MSEKPITEEQRGLLRHALGVRRKGDVPGAYRNYYAAEPDGLDAGEWRVLVKLGFAIEHSRHHVFGSLVTFSATQHGYREAVWS